MCDIRILTQYSENYSDTDAPYWKKKGGYTFTIKDVDFDLVMYCSNLKEILSNLVEVQNDEHNKYEYLEHEIQFHSEDYSITKSMLLKTIQEKDGSVRKDRTTSSRNT
jgi:hypothetical protein|tara:strand:+ start:289 stop:612 length:324 start_codon:yes stop_codon:yes gene_type:complete